MNGLLRIALKLLLNDRGKFATLVLGITFSAFLIMQMTSMFSGVLYQSSANIVNIGAKMWVMDPAVETPQNSIPMPDDVLDAVRSIPGVKFAVPLYVGAGLVKLGDGTYQSATIIGLDDATLFGRPKIIAGNILDIYKNNAFVMVKDSNYGKLGSPKIGTSFEINDHRAVIAALAHTSVPGLFGLPTLYTTYTRATQDMPSTRYMTSYILVQPKDAADIMPIEAAVKRLGYLALTDRQFVARNDNFYEYKTGMGTNILMMTLISFIVGLSIAGETFYMFILDNLAHFGALKAIGAKSTELIQMIMFQALVVGFLGFGFGVLLSSGLIAIAKIRIPNYAAMVTYGTLLLAFGMVGVISIVSSYIGIRKVTRIDPFDVFRG